MGGRMGCNKELLLVVAFGIIAFALADTCLVDAIPEDQRKYLVNDGESYPLGLWINGWPAGFVTAHVVWILLEDMLGFHVQATGVGSMTVDSFYAMAGCRTPTQVQDRGCTPAPSSTRSHISVEGWTESYVAEWAEVQRDLPHTAPRNLGKMGYFGRTSMYLPSSIQEAAYRDEGWILEFYRGYNVSWTNPAKYFDPLELINRSLLLPCNETRLLASEAMEFYASITGDWDGVEVEVPHRVRGKCFGDYFWYPPGCRENPSQCVPFITGGSGWNLDETMQKATAWNMPITPAVAKDWTTYTKLPLQVRSTFYWWVPDPTFLRLKPVEISFPPFDRMATLRGDKRTAPSDMSLDKYVSKDLSVLAPEAQGLAEAFLLDLQTVNDMLLDLITTGDSYRDVACRWLRANEDLWRSWLPDPTACYAQFGLYHLTSRQFVKDREDMRNLVCKACPSGTYSKKLVDRKGLTNICESCPIGTAQASGASLACEPCNSGYYQDINGSTSCKRCGIGKYQDGEGEDGCKPCPVGTTTLGFGSKSSSDCVCHEHYINVETEHTAVAKCMACTEGLHCPLGSSLESLKSGYSDIGEAYTPSLEKGFFATREEPMAVFKCGAKEHCPGGPPGECAGGRELVPCSECPAGTSWVADTCMGCERWKMALWLCLLLLLMAGLSLAYYVMNPPLRSKASPREAMGICFGIGVSLVQNLAIMGLMTVKWSGSFQTVSDASRIFLLDVENLSVSCLVNGPTSLRYISSVLVFPAGLSWLAFCFVVSKRAPAACRLRGHVWSEDKTKNTMGHFLQVGFSTMAALALQPLMCYAHPNGLRSLLKHPGVLCGSDTHSMMLVAGLLLLVAFVLSFIGACAWAAYKLPAWSATNPKAVVSSAFLFNRFRRDRWWYGVPLLLRGPMLSLSVVCATNFPAAQVAAGTVIIAAVLSMLLLLISLTPSVETLDAMKESEAFHEVISFLLLMFMATALLVVLGVLSFAVVDHVLRKKRVEYAFLNLSRLQSHLVSQMLRDTAAELMNTPQELMEKGFGRLNPMDLERIHFCIGLISLELLDDTRSSRLNRIKAQRATRATRLSLTFGDGGASTAAVAKMENWEGVEAACDVEVPSENHAALAPSVPGDVEKVVIGL
ncbi:unnamed protein product [Durusdinium trenchii]|uniref:Tyrosine-protein kinase ephrin type A/B receptor-like domain-containing protein n=2 Tax=Durusdinium trenchii TaxID=1381693 RepID=A0ABP0PT14_9DINO